MNLSLEREKAVTKLIAICKQVNIGPARRIEVNSSTRLIWYVDNNDDRFVECATSKNSLDFLLLGRDGRATRTFVCDDLVEIRCWITDRLNAMSSSTESSQAR